MAGKQKNIKPTLSDFLRYRENKMTNEERNAFERELQKDPFMEEAFEGLSELSSADISSDISKLKSKFNIPHHRKSRFVYYRIAASAAILMAISSVFIIIERNRSKEEISFDENKRSAIEVQESKGLRAPAETIISGKIADNEPATVKKEKAGEKMALAVEKQNAVQAVGQIVVRKPDTIRTEKIAEPERMVAEEALAAPKAAAMRSEKAYNPMISGRVLSSDDLKPIPGAEDIVIMTDRRTTVGYKSAEPAPGMVAFKKYIDNKIVKPDIFVEGERVVVIVSFKVKTDGLPDSIKVIRSSGQPYSDEAIRLIKEGPAWKPAMDNGKAVEEEVRVRIVFK